MPLRFDVEEYLGTNADHSCSDEYCYYCLKDGNYTVDISMNEMVDIWVKYTDKYNWYSGTDYTPQELKTLLNKRLPTLKRWRQKEMTQHVHYEAVNGVRTYIDQNLFHELDPEQLAEMVHLSFFHFRKVFRNVTGENIGTYIQRLRLEYIAHLLIATGQSIEEICRLIIRQSLVWQRLLRSISVFQCQLIAKSINLSMRNKNRIVCLRLKLNVSIL